MELLGNVVGGDRLNSTCGYMVVRCGEMWPEIGKDKKYECGDQDGTALVGAGGCSMADFGNC